MNAIPYIDHDEPVVQQIRDFFAVKAACPDEKALARVIATQASYQQFLAALKADQQSK